MERAGEMWRGRGRWICWERGTDEWKTRWAALIRDHFSCLRNFDLCASVWMLASAAGRCTSVWKRFFRKCRLVPEGFPSPVGADETLWQPSYFTHVIKWSLRFCGTETVQLPFNRLFLHQAWNHTNKKLDVIQQVLTLHFHLTSAATSSISRIFNQKSYFCLIFYPCKERNYINQF